MIGITMFDEITEKETIFLFLYTSPLNKSKEKKLSFCNYILSIEVLIEGGFINDTIAIVLSKFVTKKNGVLIFLNLYCENGFFFSTSWVLEYSNRTILAFLV